MLQAQIMKYCFSYIKLGLVEKNTLLLGNVSPWTLYVLCLYSEEESEYEKPGPILICIKEGAGCVLRNAF